MPAIILLDLLIALASYLIVERWLLGASAGGAVLTHTPALVAPCAVFIASYIFLAFALGFASQRAWTSPEQPKRIAARAFGWSAAAAIAVLLLTGIEAPSLAGRGLVAHALLLGAISFAAMPAAARLAVGLAAGRAAAPRRALVLGKEGDALRIAAQLDWDERHGREIVGLVDLAATDASRDHCRPRFRAESCNEIPQLAEALAADEVILCSPYIARRDAVLLAGRLATAGVKTLAVPALTGLFVTGAPISWPGSVPLLQLGGARPDRWGRYAKRAFDISIASIGGLLLLPLMILVTIAVKLSSPGPVLHSQTRIGKGGRRFEMYKFRSMLVAGDDSRHRSYVASLVTHGDAAGVDASGRPIYKIVDDPRVTGVGRLIRRMSIDELPQLINVLKGEMSLVGPRPPLPFEFDLYDDWQRRRLLATPGMTGLWQVSGRNLLGFEEMVLLDLYYASNWSFVLDLKLIWRTIPEVLHARGAR